jgi:hypothetical protein
MPIQKLSLLTSYIGVRRLPERMPYRVSQLLDVLHAAGDDEAQGCAGGHAAVGSGAVVPARLPATNSIAPGIAAVSLIPGSTYSALREWAPLFRMLWWPALTNDEFFPPSCFVPAELTSQAATPPMLNMHTSSRASTHAPS